MQNKRVMIVGGTGFVGRHLLFRLTKAGWQCRVASRHPERHRELKLIPGVSTAAVNPYDPESVRDGLEGCSALINLAGILNPSGRQTFEHVHVELVKSILKGARKAGVSRYLHMSALKANAVNGSSQYLISKGHGEAAAHTTDDIEPTSFRPSVIFGRGDSFINRFAGLLKSLPGVFPLACPDARFAPVWVGDVAEAMMRAIDDPGTIGHRYDLCGPRIYTLSEIVEYTARTMGQQTLIAELNDFASKWQARVLQFAPGKPFTPDNYGSLQTDSLCKHNGLKDLGIEPARMERVVPSYLLRR